MGSWGSRKSIGSSSGRDPAPVAALQAPLQCCVQLWILSTAGPGSSCSGASGGCGAEEGPGASRCPGKAEGAGAVQPGEEPQLRGALSPGCPCVQGGAEQGPGSAPGAQQWHQSHGQGLSPGKFYCQEAELLSCAVTESGEGSESSSLGISQNHLAAVQCRALWDGPAGAENQPRLSQRSAAPWRNAL